MGKHEGRGPAQRAWFHPPLPAPPVPALPSSPSPGPHPWTCPELRVDNPRLPPSKTAPASPTQAPLLTPQETVAQAKSLPRCTAVAVAGAGKTLDLHWTADSTSQGPLALLRFCGAWTSRLGYLSRRRGVRGVRKVNFFFRRRVRNGWWGLRQHGLGVLRENGIKKEDKTAAELATMK